MKKRRAAEEAELLSQKNGQRPPIADESLHSNDSEDELESDSDESQISFADSADAAEDDETEGEA